MSPRALAAAIALATFVVATPPARVLADEPTGPALAVRREALLAFGVDPRDPAMDLGERATARCARTPASVFCAIAEAAYELAAARAELAGVLALATERGVPPVRLEGDAGLHDARRAVPALAPRYDQALARERRATGPEARAAATLARLLSELMRTRGTSVVTLERIAAAAPPIDRGAALERAQVIADETIRASREADDIYVARRRAGTERERARDRVTAANTLVRALPVRIAALPEADRAPRTAAYEAARALADVDARLDALLDLAGDLDAHSEVRPAAAAAPPSSATP